MMKIGYLVEWTKNREITWSGTPYGIYKALSKTNQLVDLNLTKNRLETLTLKSIKKLLSLAHVDFIYKLNEIYSKKANKMIENSNQEIDYIFSFVTYFTSKISKTFIYQDFSINYLSELRKKDQELSNYTPLPSFLSDKVVARKLEQENRFFKDCGGLFTMSKFLCDYMKKSGVIAPDKVHYAGGGCNVDTSKIDYSKKNGKRFLFVGKDFERKNGRLVIEAFRKLVKEQKDVSLYLIGPESLPSDITLPERTEFLGNISYDQLANYYNLCDYFVLPSKVEAYGLVFAEALIFGLPCIGRDAFAMPEFIEDGVNGYLLKDIDSSDELYKKMKELINNQEMKDYVKKHQEDYIYNYSWDRVAERIQEVLENQ